MTTFSLYDVIRWALQLEGSGANAKVMCLKRQAEDWLIEPVLRPILVRELLSVLSCGLLVEAMTAWDLFLLLRRRMEFGDPSRYEKDTAKLICVSFAALRTRFESHGEAEMIEAYDVPLDPGEDRDASARMFLEEIKQSIWERKRA